MPSQTSPRWAVCAAVSLAFFAANAGQGVAQVHVDPNSPAGKEYALPLDTARDGAGGADVPSGGTSSSAPMFGEGISSARSARQEQAEAGNRSEGGSQAGHDDREASVAAGTASKSVSAAAVDAGSSMPAGFLTALIALGVLGVGMAVGLSLRSLRAGSKNP